MAWDWVGGKEKEPRGEILHIKDKIYIYIHIYKIKSCWVKYKRGEIIWSGGSKESCFELNPRSRPEIKYGTESQRTVTASSCKCPSTVSIWLMLDLVMRPSACNACSVCGSCPEISTPSSKVIFTLYLTDRACVYAKNTAGNGYWGKSKKSWPWKKTGLSSKEVILKSWRQCNAKEPSRSKSLDLYHTMVGKNICLKLLWGKTDYGGLILCFWNDFIFFSSELKGEKPKMILKILVGTPWPTG